MRKQNIRRIGNLTLIMAIIIGLGGGLVAMEIIPSLTTENQRHIEENLSFSLGEMRMAIALERMSKMTALFDGDWLNRASFLAYLQKIVELGFLREIPADPTMLPEKWGSASGRAFWIPTRNFVASSGFEASSLNQTKWKTGSANIVASITTKWTWPGDALGGYGRSAVLVNP